MKMLYMLLEKKAVNSTTKDVMIQNNVRNLELRLRCNLEKRKVEMIEMSLFREYLMELHR